MFVRIRARHGAVPTVLYDHLWRGRRWRGDYFEKSESAEMRGAADKYEVLYNLETALMLKLKLKLYSTV